jgi:hypothetical protein
VWSLQNAILYTSQLFLDKSMTRRTWSILLDPDYAPLSTRECQRRLIYASSDCFAVTYLHRPIRESWSLNKLHESRLTSLFTSTDPPHVSLSLLRMALEDISEDEDGETHQVFNSFFVDHGDHPPPVTSIPTIAHFNSVADMGEVIDSKSSELDQSCTARVHARRAVRSTKARRRRNRKCNVFLRPLRDRHVLIRPFYHRFTMRQITQLLRERDVRYTHLTANRQSIFFVYWCEEVCFS